MLPTLWLVDVKGNIYVEGEVLTRKGRVQFEISYIYLFVDICMYT